MKTQNLNNKLAFGKATVTELNDNQLNEVNGGTSWACAGVSLVVFLVGIGVGIAQELREN